MEASRRKGEMIADALGSLRIGKAETGTASGMVKSGIWSDGGAAGNGEDVSKDVSLREEEDNR